jgi:hypothetical protein
MALLGILDIDILQQTDRFNFRNFIDKKIKKTHSSNDRKETLKTGIPPST